ncbi:MAG: SsrA-binding protein SmpB [Alphaproteobacteria bacterium]|nr:SsrA-binding protein SmpB [Alphaproteobacteria bacterium]
MAKKDTARKKPMLSVNETVADNRKARFEYHIEERFEAGIVLHGTEVKSLRLGQCSLGEAFADEKGGEIWVYNMHIPEYQQAGKHLQHDPKRPKKLILHKKQVHKLMGAVNRDGYTIVPTRLYFNGRGMAKLEIALAKGKKLHDKRAATKDREWNREKSRTLRNQN